MLLLFILLVGWFYTHFLFFLFLCMLPIFLPSFFWDFFVFSVLHDLELAASARVYHRWHCEMKWFLQDV
jgi:hypothetical protein